MLGSEMSLWGSEETSSISSPAAWKSQPLFPHTQSLGHVPASLVRRYRSEGPCGSGCQGRPGQAFSLSRSQNSLLKEKERGWLAVSRQAVPGSCF